jgi:exodeoxyribonuclease-3
MMRFFITSKKITGKEKALSLRVILIPLIKKSILARPKENVKNSGFMPIEREWIDRLLNLGYVDIFRTFNQEPEQYTYWDQFTKARDRNVGWRIDYFMVSEDIVKHVTAAEIHADVYGSDHCPISITIDL